MAVQVVQELAGEQMPRRRGENLVGELAQGVVRHAEIIQKRRAGIRRSVSGARLQSLDEVKDLFRRTHVLHFRENRHERVGVSLRPRGLRLAAQLLRLSL